jgi:hypothetical protein
MKYYFCWWLFYVSAQVGYQLDRAKDRHKWESSKSEPVWDFLFG